MEQKMKYKKGDKVFFVKIPNKIYSWILKENIVYEIESFAFDPLTCLDRIKVKHTNNCTTCWFEEEDFISIKELRKQKINKINKYEE